MMLDVLAQLIILFFVIIDPFASFVIFLSATRLMGPRDKTKTAVYAILVAFVLSFLVLILGENLLVLFSTTLDEFRIAAGVVLFLLGIRMALGHSLTIKDAGDRSGRAIASIIGTPLLTGPATITTIIVSTADYGRLLTGFAIAIVLAITALIFLLSTKIKKVLGLTFIQIISTILGLITIAWAVKFITVGIQNIFMV
jgi:multiple antibiotic resistance protein